ncbi:hypothetical protein [Hymenobacter psychrotolerans]|uniref:Uncharacterized protein n=1 Tax=Hymenobacter psychrotolerans DSM 18569 TaxID=1121959 RepID=A0A1M7E5R2_9BACT|nr:hypothetical protein [Hymenobacter psychrotolerans]SHL87016.1 hypothetical protein SAMN02746009_03523 [Hymenobacter psychrotolerans DSM 18569]
MSQVFDTPISLTDARTGRRVRVQQLPAGSALVAAPEPILGYTYQRGHLTVYVSGTMPPQLRTAEQEGCLEQEVLLVPVLPAGIREIDLTDCRREFHLLLPQAA